jgi:hypothetical protein
VSGDVRHASGGRFVRVVDQARPAICLTIDGTPATALDGDTVMTAVLASRRHLRQSEWGDGNRAGFCLMAACQDCWIWTESGRRLRACTEPARDGMALLTAAPAAGNSAGGNPAGTRP